MSYLLEFEPEINQIKLVINIYLGGRKYYFWSIRSRWVSICVYEQKPKPRFDMVSISKLFPIIVKCFTIQTVQIFFCFRSLSSSHVHVLMITTLKGNNLSYLLSFITWVSNDCQMIDQNQVNLRNSLCFWNSWKHTISQCGPGSSATIRRPWWNFGKVMIIFVYSDFLLFNKLRADACHILYTNNNQC